MPVSISSLPDELLVYIFVAGSMGLDPHLPRLAWAIGVASVPHRWRCVAVRASQLWTSIDIIISNFNGTDAEIIMERSRPYLVDVVVTVDVYVPIPDVIGINSSRVKHLTIKCPSWRVWKLYIWPEVAKMNFGNLVSFETESTEWLQTLECRDHHLTFPVTPNLRRLNSAGCLLCLPIGPNLQELCLKRFECSSPSLHLIMESCPSLEVLNLEIESYPNHHPSTVADIEAKNLHSLMINTTGCHAISAPSPFAVFRVQNVSFLMLCGLLQGELHNKLQLPIFEQLKTLALVDCFVSKRDVELISGYRPVEELVVIDTNDKAIWLQNPAIPHNGLPWPALCSVTSHSRRGSYEAMLEVLAAFKRNSESEPSLVLRTGFDGQRNSFPSFNERMFTIEEVKNLLPHIRVEGVDRESARLHLKRKGKLQR